jgi:hypothetical protein
MTGSRRFEDLVILPDGRQLVTLEDAGHIDLNNRKSLAPWRNHAGKGVQRTNEGSPARWMLHTT